MSLGDGVIGVRDLQAQAFDIHDTSEIPGISGFELTVAENSSEARTMEAASNLNKPVAQPQQGTVATLLDSQVLTAKLIEPAGSKSKKSTIGSVISFIKSIARKAWEGIKNAFSAVGRTLAGFVQPKSPVKKADGQNTPQTPAAQTV